MKYILLYKYSHWMKPILPSPSNYTLSHVLQWTKEWFWVYMLQFPPNKWLFHVLRTFLPRNSRISFIPNLHHYLLTNEFPHFWRIERLRMTTATEQQLRQNWRHNCWHLALAHPLYSYRATSVSSVRDFMWLGVYVRALVIEPSELLFSHFWLTLFNRVCSWYKYTFLIE